MPKTKLNPDLTAWPAGPDPSAPQRSPNEIQIDLEAGSLAGLHYHHASPRHRLLATHGWLDNAASFSRLLPELGLDESIALDLPGHGHSAWLPPGLSYHFIDSVVAMIDALDRLRWDSCVLVGHSLGAGVMPLVAALVPEKVRGLILIDGLGPLTTSAAEAPAVLQKALRDRTQNRAPKIYPEPGRAVERLLKRELTRDAAERLAARGLREVPGGWQFGHDPRLTWTSRLRMTEEHVHAYLQMLKCPTLLLVASRGPIATHAIFSDRVRMIPRLTRVDFEAGHHFHLEQPELALGAILPFLNEI